VRHTAAWIPQYGYTVIPIAFHQEFAYRGTSSNLLRRKMGAFSAASFLFFDTFVDRFLLIFALYCAGEAGRLRACGMVEFTIIVWVCMMYV
jgi:hypothetical protein